MVGVVVPAMTLLLLWFMGIMALALTPLFREWEWWQCLLFVVGINLMTAREREE